MSAFPFTGKFRPTLPRAFLEIIGNLSILSMGKLPAVSSFVNSQNYQQFTEFPTTPPLQNFQ